MYHTETHGQFSILLHHVLPYIRSVTREARLYQNGTSKLIELTCADTYVYGQCVGPIENTDNTPK